MGFLGFGNYNKPGRGVEKDAPERRAFFRFFELYFRKFWQIMNTALIYFFTAIPMFIVVMAASFFVVTSFSAMNGGALRAFFGESYMYMVVMISFFISLVYIAFIGAGPVSAGYSHVMSSFAGDYHTFIWEDFKEKSKENFKQGLAVFLIDLVVFVALAYAFIIYYDFGGMIGYIRYIIVVIAILFAAMHLYIYPMMVSYELKIREIYKNAFLLTMVNLPINLILLAVILIIHYYMARFIGGFQFNMLPVFILLEAFLLYGITGFISNFRSEIVFNKYFNAKGDNCDGNN